ncbi:phosphoglycolate phosphatase [Haloferax mediterranei ATCC 33500]|uniref:Phosphoglycolate phosphatase n=1 Tax=Haloferax mediterranei (strain ATCC 33500 / DSM 1411 / JCM 8866 / NBRC 14739 / NCIMB 2177 / R-4) TaxID=523841 RepID=I3R4Z3_HALMT|nr:phosphoglycolate phosphatase [Haloferax mediterranei]AFK19303.1 phosphoglycolate phosphatase [Haloferax mediterranei ATCC 33500]AHZ21340.1 phosphoglycolate phosphatase [Haloferax mediterranei ATCC 33500]EMA04508.1 phosphoglycolate phosphatase [Haloferax mediterranei ATCC 33500]MDX5989407.1 phosphoglycolate phosphatase [Haloferax mediterranei ATCC 33500]QCQ75771.1 phosphoglycolate phosphatase [Haloferax mediterranei ATCC 33500]
MVPPLVLDIDGTLTDAQSRLDPRAFDVLPSWDAPVILATGKAFPYPVSLCHYLGLPETVIAENGGVVLVDGEVTYAGNREAAQAVADEFVARGGDLGWGTADTVNRWRETEIAVSLDADEALLRDVADAFDLEVIDTGFAYHVKSHGVEKGVGLEHVCETIDYDPEDFVAIGDSENDASTFRVVGQSYAVANADEVAKAAADEVLEESYMDGTYSVLDALRE